VAVGRQLEPCHALERRRSPSRFWSWMQFFLLIVKYLNKGDVFEGDPDDSTGIFE
jgi:hypothetical protein